MSEVKTGPWIDERSGKTRTVIDPITRIEGHLRAEVQVEDGVVTDCWMSGGAFRGMELVVENRTPEDAAMIVQRICGVCPVSHCHVSCIAGEQSYGIAISNTARILRNIVEGAQFLHSHILWFYNLCALDYVNPLNALNANPDAAQRLAETAGTSTNTDFRQLAKRLQAFADNGQLSIFSGNWFAAKGAGGKAYNLPPELDLICTAHYLEALTMQSKASEIAGLVGGKMPHIMTSTVGGTMWVPTEEKLDDLLSLANQIYDWVSTTMIQDTLAIAPYYTEALSFGAGCKRFVAWGVFDRPYDGADPITNYNAVMNNRYLPAGVVDFTGSAPTIRDVEENLITEYVGHSWYKGSDTYTSPYFVTQPEFTKYDTEDRYTWNKGPAYDGKPHEAGPLSRLLAAYVRGEKFIVDNINAVLSALGTSDPSVLMSTLGRTAGRQVEALYIAGLMKEWIAELMLLVKGGSLKDLKLYTEPAKTTGAGTGFWEAPRGALYHSESVENGKIKGYQIIIPTTWNIAPHDANNVPGPIEQAMIGVPVDDLDMPLNVLRTVHSFDPCTACAVHVTEPSTGRHFETVTSPWGVK